MLNKKIIAENRTVGISSCHKNRSEVTIFSGGTGWNDIAREFHTFFSNVNYILTTTDNGGSTGQIRELHGGPGCGDHRSRIIRLADESTTLAQSLKKLLAKRLTKDTRSKAKKEWFNILHGTGHLWDNIPQAHRNIILTSLLKFEQERIMKTNEFNFDFRGGSIGNFFFAGTRLMYDSLDSAIYMFSRLLNLPQTISVIPTIKTNDFATIGVELRSGELIKGQNEISHPSPKNKPTSFDKHHQHKLPSPIKKLFYLNKYGDIFNPEAHPQALSAIGSSDALIYSIGSLYTSIIANLIVEGVGEKIAAGNFSKIKLLNGYNDRETYGMNSIDYIIAVTEGLNRYGKLRNRPEHYIQKLFYTENSKIPVDLAGIKAMGITPVKVKTASHSSTDEPHYSKSELLKKIQQEI
ncbi:MAG: YvcK family protein [Candidatus Margulisbacteria bacterium]|nr:YvcK family protein [Candidatus Margulisiibacteriota bacterium]